MRIAVIGAGKSGCISALSAKYLSDLLGIKLEIEIYHDPSIVVNSDSVGVPYATVKLLYNFHQKKFAWRDAETGFDATLKTGILYKDWGKGGFAFHGDDGGTLMHFIPKKFSDYILAKKEFKVIEKNISDAESEIDADVIIDCRGRNENIQYQSIINPTNSSMSASKDFEDCKEWSDHIARPHGWILGIPNKKSMYYEYFYNNEMSKKDDVISDFKDFLGILPQKYKHLNNYFANDVFVGERTIINGSRFCSLEPMESVSLEVYQYIAIKGLKYFFGLIEKEQSNNKIFNRMMKWESMLLWCYDSGSIYDTNFWNYAKNLDYRDIVKDKFLNLVDNCAVSEKMGQGVERMSSNIFLDQWNKAGI